MTYGPSLCVRSMKQGCSSKGERNMAKRVKGFTRGKRIGRKTTLTIRRSNVGAIDDSVLLADDGGGVETD